MLHTAENTLTTRELTGLSQTKFGKLIQATKDMVHSYESGRAKPSDDAVKIMAGFVGITTELFHGKKLEREDFDSEVVKKAVQDYVSRPGLHVNTNTGDIRDKLIASLERENKRLQKDLDLSLGELRHNILLTRAMQETTQELLAELLAKQRKMTIEEIAADVGIKNGEKYLKLKEEGNFAYVGK